MDESPHPVSDRYTLSLDQSLQELQGKIDQHREELAALQRNTNPRQNGSGPGREPYEVMRGAFEQVASTPPFKKRYDRETTKLLKALRNFIDGHLGGQLAAEDLGGPVVGDMMEIDSDQLGAGFNAQGRPVKVKSKVDEDKRQRRLEEVWGLPQEDAGREQGNADEVAAAGREMRDLTEQLLNQHAEAAGDSTAAYVKLSKETAAARFLVRSKVAQFHPRDATRLKLIDFGRELDD
ncbi:hypothetical protein CSAL01_00891 [Colletotrichum salicis]|uniref:Uncharacterized protein n=1 Tax=Colletotrichum salicis TaxID=1209931 RepID=A0A135V198_9PEZI|nr:hypothetical protein CSAL01_00891 [Colletotrichum salicis]